MKQMVSDKFCCVLILLLLLSFVSGCTMWGFGLGEVIDDSFTKESSREIVESDTCSFKKKDLVVLTLKDGAKLEGKVREIQPGRSLTLFVENPMTSNYKRYKDVLIPWNAIDAVIVLHKPLHFRLVFGLLGLCVDTVVVMYAIALSGMGTVQ